MISLQTQFPEPMESVVNSPLRENEVWEGELTHCRRDGNPIIVLSSWALHRDRDGRPVSILENNIDITARKQAEQILSEQAEELASQGRGAHSIPVSP